jgi:hypothetical protein
MPASPLAHEHDSVPWMPLDRGFELVEGPGSLQQWHEAWAGWVWSARWCAIAG